MTTTVGAQPIDGDWFERLNADLYRSDWADKSLTLQDIMEGHGVDEAEARELSFMWRLPWPKPYQAPEDEPAFRTSRERAIIAGREDPHLDGLTEAQRHNNSYAKSTDKYRMYVARWLEENHISRDILKSIYETHETHKSAKWIGSISALYIALGIMDIPTRMGRRVSRSAKRAPLPDVQQMRGQRVMGAVVNPRYSIRNIENGGNSAYARSSSYQREEAKRFLASHDIDRAKLIRLYDTWRTADLAEHFDGKYYLYVCLGVMNIPLRGSGSPPAGDRPEPFPNRIVEPIVHVTAGDHVNDGLIDIVDEWTHAEQEPVHEVAAPATPSVGFTIENLENRAAELRQARKAAETSAAAARAEVVRLDTEIDLITDGIKALTALASVNRNGTLGA